MVFSNTTTKAGIIQTVEFWTGLGDAGISGNSTLLSIITGRVNSAFDRLMPLLLSYCDKMRWDDYNNSDRPVATFNLVANQEDYKITEDDNNLDILNIVGVHIYESSTATRYSELQRMTMDDPRALEAMSPTSTTTTATPTHFLEMGNVLYLFPEPSYSATNGIKIFFEREQSYFTSSDTTKEPGIPKPFHELLALYASHDWLLVNKPDNGTLLTRLEAQIARREKQLKDSISTRAPTHEVMRGKGINYV